MDSFVTLQRTGGGDNDDCSSVATVSHPCRGSYSTTEVRGHPVARASSRTDRQFLVPCWSS